MIANHLGRTAAYVRSAVLGGPAVLSQFCDFHAVAQPGGLDVVGRSLAGFLSGLTKRRLGLDRLLADAAAGHLEVVLATLLDRLSRFQQQLHSASAQAYIAAIAPTTAEPGMSNVAMEEVGHG